MSERDKLYKDFRSDKISYMRVEKHNAYKAKRNLVTSNMRKAKKDYFNAFFEENQGNVKETWKGIRNLINISKKSPNNISKLVVNGNATTNPKEMADIINKFYVNIGKSIEEKIPNGRKTFAHYLRDRNLYNIVLNPCTTEEVTNYISNMTASKATGPNSIPTSVLKFCTVQLIEPLMNVLNKSLSEGTFPDMLVCFSVPNLHK